MKEKTNKTKIIKQELDTEMRNRKEEREEQEGETKKEKVKKEEAPKRLKRNKGKHR